MKALLTGATGFIGSHLAESLIARGYEVFCLTRHDNPGWLKHAKVTWVKGDIGDPESLKKAVNTIDIVFHLGGLTKAKTESEYYKVNAKGSRNVCEACFSNPNLKKLVYVSSLAAAGPSLDKPKQEGDENYPLTFYGKSKLEGETITKNYMNRLPITVIRPPAVYGPREKDIFFYFRLIRLHLQLQLGFETKELSMIYVMDLIDAIILAAEKKESDGQTYFVDDGNIYTWQNLSDTIKKSSGTWTLPVIIPEWLITGVAYFAEFFSSFSKSPALLNRQKIIELKQKSWTCSSQKIRNELGFTSHYDLTRGIQETWNWYKANKWL